MRDENYVGVVYSNSNKYNNHNMKYWFRPAENYPEKDDFGGLAEKNDVYDAVRSAFYLMGMDENNYGTKKWNPLGELIKPGDTVLIKPNMVMDYNQSGEGTDCLYTNPQVVVPVLDYVIIALNGTGKIIIGDAPMQECLFDKLVIESGYKEIIDFYKKQRGISIELVDFRGLVTEIKGKKRKGVRCQTIRPHAYGKVIDLGKQSEFSQYDDEHLSNLRITNYSPDRLREHHNGESHEYYISGYVLEANVIIDIPKPKTHRKAGFTAAMKNMVGINVRKEYLPHHTIGAVQDGGDEYKKRSCLRRIDARLYDWKNTCEGMGKFKKATVLWYIAGVLRVFANKFFEDEGEGSWYGNQTISKTIVDLNKILNYVNKEGKLCTTKQRNIIHIGDMIISGEKEGPVAPSPKSIGAIIISQNAFSFDYVVGTLMGAKIDEIPFIKDTLVANSCHKLVPEETIKIISNNVGLNNVEVTKIKDEYKWYFKSTRGWKELFYN